MNPFTQVYAIDPTKFQKPRGCPKCGNELRDGYCRTPFCTKPERRKAQENIR